MLSNLIVALTATLPSLPTTTITAAEVFEMMTAALAWVFNGIVGLFATMVNVPVLFIVLVIAISLIVIGAGSRLINLRA